MKINNILGDVFKEMPKFKDCKFNTIFSDFPYNLGSKIYIDKEDGKYKYKGESKEFMSAWCGITSKQWETFAEQSFRILKYGGYCIAFGMDEQFPLIQYYMIRAGFVKTQSIFWYYIQNFPKSYDISKGVSKALEESREIGDEIICPDGRLASQRLCKKKDININLYNLSNKKKRHCYISKGTSKLSQAYEGYKGSIKPLKQTVETIYVFRKPLKTGGIISDILAMHGGDDSISPACLGIENNRVVTDDNLNGGAYSNTGYENRFFVGKKTMHPDKYEQPQGRFPANTFINLETAKILDGQSGIVTEKEKRSNVINQGKKGIFTNSKKGDLTKMYNSFGEGCSRILKKCKLTKYELGEYNLYNYSPKVSNFERNLGCENLEKKEVGSLNGSKDGFLNGDSGKPKPKGNNHVSLKPISLLKNIISLFKLPEIANQKVLVPFSGAGSELIALLLARYTNVTGIEINENYHNIATHRLIAWEKYKDIDIKKVPEIAKKTNTNTNNYKLF